MCTVLFLLSAAPWAVWAQGHLQVAPEGHWLEFRGKKVLLIGDSVTHGWQALGQNFDQQAYVAALAARGINVLLLWSYIGIVEQAADPRIGYDAPEIWPWVKTGKTFDLTRLNDAYFRRLRDFVKLAHAKDIVVVITVRDGWTKRRFSGHPFNADLGGPLTNRSQYVELLAYDREMPVTFDPSWERLPQGSILGQESMQLRGFEGPQHHPYHRQQQEGQAGKGPRPTPVALGGGFPIVFFDQLHYLEQCVGGDGVEVGSHKPQSLQSILVLCYPRPIYAQASYYLLGRTEEAIEPLQRVLSVYPHRVEARVLLAVVYSEVGKAAEARAEAAEILRINPKFSLEVHRQRVPIKDPAQLERLLTALQKAGLQ